MFLCQWSVCMSNRSCGDMIKCFYDDLQDVLNGIPPNDLLLMLGDLNVHVGVRDESSELW